MLYQVRNFFLTTIQKDKHINPQFVFRVCAPYLNYYRLKSQTLIWFAINRAFLFPEQLHFKIIQVKYVPVRVPNIDF
jgi:hypothetical protein